mmetsp:Transcript_115347/g.322444  ORF Transcript_115347/g.322444 Transcript_115347/m.322444 type:complete len:296 (-) Transcript_115347:84-971(-)
MAANADAACAVWSLTSTPDMFPANTAHSSSEPSAQISWPARRREASCSQLCVAAQPLPVRVPLPIDSRPRMRVCTWASLMIPLCTAPLDTSSKAFLVSASIFSITSPKRLGNLSAGQVATSTRLPPKGSGPVPKQPKIIAFVALARAVSFATEMPKAGAYSSIVSLFKLPRTLHTLTPISVERRRNTLMPIAMTPNNKPLVHTMHAACGRMVFDFTTSCMLLCATNRGPARRQQRLGNLSLQRWGSTGNLSLNTNNTAAMVLKSNVGITRAKKITMSANRAVWAALLAQAIGSFW